MYSLLWECHLQYGFTQFALQLNECNNTKYHRLNLPQLLGGTSVFALSFSGLPFIDSFYYRTTSLTTFNLQHYTHKFFPSFCTPILIDLSHFGNFWEHVRLSEHWGYLSPALIFTPLSNNVFLETCNYTLSDK